MTATDGFAVTIRPERPDDHAAVDAVVRDGFGSDVQVRLVHAIRRSPGYLPRLALVAEAAGRVVGHVVVSHAHLLDETTGARHRVPTLSPLAVRPEVQGLGIGGALVRAVTAEAHASGETLVVLEGSPAYYRRFGFEPSAPHGILIDLPAWAPPEAAQMLLLPGHDPAVRGRLVFDALDESR